MAKRTEAQKRATEAGAKASRTFETVEEFNQCANAYFKSCDESGALYGEAGLALYLNEHNPKGHIITVTALRRWYDGEFCEYLQDAVHLAYMRIAAQIETDPRYQEKGGMATRGIFLQKQRRIAGYSDRENDKKDTTVNIVFGDNMTADDFK